MHCQVQELQQAHNQALQSLKSSVQSAIEQFAAGELSPEGLLQELQGLGIDADVSLPTITGIGQDDNRPDNITNGDPGQLQGAEDIQPGVSFRCIISHCTGVAMVGWSTTSDRGHLQTGDTYIHRSETQLLLLVGCNMLRTKFPEAGPSWIPICLQQQLDRHKDGASPSPITPSGYGIKACMTHTSAATCRSQKLLTEEWAPQLQLMSHDPERLARLLTTNALRAATPGIAGPR